MAQSASSSVAKHAQDAAHGEMDRRRASANAKTAYADDLRPNELGRAPPVADRVAAREKALPSYFGGRDTLERMREQLRYQSDMDRFRKRSGVECAKACTHSFRQPDYSTCNAHQRFVRLGKRAASPESNTSAYADKVDDGSGAEPTMRATLDSESATLAKQIALVNTQLAHQRHGFLYADLQQSVRGADAVARRPVASVEVESALKAKLEDGK